VSGCQPSEQINNSSDSRTEISSSTTKTIGIEPGDLLPGTVSIAISRFIPAGMKEFATELISHSLPCGVISSPPHCGAFSLSAKPQIVESWLPLNGEAGCYHFRGIGKIKPLAFRSFDAFSAEKPGIERPCARTDHCQGGAKRRRHNVNQGISCERESDPNLK